jgi:hypothetical protein
METIAYIRADQPNTIRVFEIGYDRQVGFLKFDGTIADAKRVLEARGWKLLEDFAKRGADDTLDCEVEPA